MYQALQKTFRLLAITLLSGALAGQVYAEPVTADSEIVLVADTSLQFAAKTANSKYGGEVVKAETVEKDGKQVHQIRLLIDGRVKNVDFDASSGKEL